MCEFVGIKPVLEHLFCDRLLGWRPRRLRQILAIMVALGFVAGCSGGGSHQGTSVPPPPPLVALEIQAPKVVTINQADNQALVPDQSQARFQWAIEGGTITQGTDTHAITFVATDVGTVHLTCTETLDSPVDTWNSQAMVTRIAEAYIKAVPPAQTPQITTARYATQNQDGYVATVPDQAGCRFDWSLDNGIITEGMGTSSITFKPQAIGDLHLECVATNEAGTAAAPGQAIVLVVPPPASPVIDAPTLVTANEPGFSASVAEQSGCTYAWIIQGGTITSIADLPSVVFTPGNSGSVILTCTAIDAAGTKISSSATATVVPQPEMPVITTRDLVLADNPGGIASVPAQPGCSFSWTIRGGSISAGADTSEITYEPGESGSVNLQCTATNQAGTAKTAEASAEIVQPAGPSLLTMNPNLSLTQRSVETITVAQSTTDDLYGYAASIDWGNGVQTPGTIVGNQIQGTPSFPTPVRGTHVQATLWDTTSPGIGCPASASVVSDGAGVAVEGLHRLVHQASSAHILQTSQFDPATAGPILSLDYQFEVDLGPTAGTQPATVSYGLLIEQGGCLFATPLQDATTPLDSESGQTSPRVLQASGSIAFSGDLGFVMVFPKFDERPPPQFALAPNFCNDPIRFGFYIASTSAVTELMKVNWTVRNWLVQVNGTRIFSMAGGGSDWNCTILDHDQLGGKFGVASQHVWVAQPSITDLAIHPDLADTGGAWNQAPVATFRMVPADPDGEYMAWIQWGDAYVSNASTRLGTIVRGSEPSTFVVLGSHDYEGASWTEPFSVTVNNAFSATRNLDLKPQVIQDRTFSLGTITLNLEAADDSHVVLLTGGGGNTGLYNLQAGGGINTLELRFSLECLSALGSLDELGVGMAVRQGDDVYVASYQGCAPGQQISFSGALVATDFQKVAGPGDFQNPDFSSAGSPLQFGYYVAHTCTSYQSLSWLGSEFDLQINGTTIEEKDFDPTHWTIIPLYQSDLGAFSASVSYHQP